MEFDGLEDDDEPVPPLLPPDDRIWRHPSEAALAARPPAGRAEREPRVAPVALLAGITGALLAAGLLSLLPPRVREVRVPAVEQVSLVPTSIARSQPTDAIVSLTSRVLPAVVEVHAAGDGDGVSATGVLYQSDGALLTNNHVVAGARSIRVVLANGREYPGRLIGGDTETDIAVVKIEGGPFPVATLGSAANLRVGEMAVAVGSPPGPAGSASVTVGVVSSLGRQVGTRSGPVLLDMIETDAPIGTEASGGPLLDATGSVIGITTAMPRLDATPGTGVATPVDIARVVAGQLVTTGRVSRCWLGVQGTDADGETSHALGIDGGAVVKEVVPGSPAARAGLRTADVITALDGKRISSMAALVVAIRLRRPGDGVRVDYRRDGQPGTTTVQLVERPA